MIKESFNDLNDMDKLANLGDNNDQEFNKILTEDENAIDIKIPYPESINNGFNFTVNLLYFIIKYLLIINDKIS